MTSKPKRVARSSWKRSTSGLSVGRWFDPGLRVRRPGSPRTGWVVEVQVTGASRWSPWMGVDWSEGEAFVGIPVFVLEFDAD